MNVKQLKIYTKTFFLLAVAALHVHINLEARTPFWWDPNQHWTNKGWWSL